MEVAGAKQPTASPKQQPTDSSKQPHTTSPKQLHTVSTNPKPTASTKQPPTASPKQTPTDSTQTPAISTKTRICQPCSDDSVIFHAIGYCKDCDEYLCNSCYSGHRIPRATKRHVLEPIVSDITSLAPGAAQAVDICTIICPEHASKVLDMYCTKHQAPICTVCALKEHKLCDVEYIPEIAEDYKNSVHYTSFKTTLEELEKEAKTGLRIVERNRAKSDHSFDDAVGKFREFKDKLAEYLETMEEELRQSSVEIHGNSENQFLKVERGCSSVKLEAAKMVMSLEKLENRSCDLFVTTNEMRGLSARLHDRLETCRTGNIARVYSFQPDQRIVQLMDAQTKLGELRSSEVEGTGHQNDSHGNSQAQEQPSHTQSQVPRKEQDLHIDFSKAKYSKCKSINVEADNDDSNCCITGSTLLTPTRLLLADWNNSCVKAVDLTPSPKVTSKVTLISKPWDVTALADNQAAVTLPELEQVQIIDTTSALSLTRFFDVNGKCCGVVALPGTEALVVSYTGEVGMVEIIDLFGRVLESIICDGTDRIVKPYYIGIVGHSTDQNIVVSDRSMHEVTRLNLNGDVLTSYTNKDLGYPCGMAVTDGGYILICNWENNSILYASPDDWKLRTLLDDRDGIDCPYSICYNRHNGEIYVTSFKDNKPKQVKNNLKVYQLQK